MVGCPDSVVDSVVRVLEPIPVVGVVIVLDVTALCGLLFSVVLTCLVMVLVCEPDVLESVRPSDFAIDVFVSLLLEVLLVLVGSVDQLLLVDCVGVLLLL